MSTKNLPDKVTDGKGNWFVVIKMTGGRGNDFVRLLPMNVTDYNLLPLLTKPVSSKSIMHLENCDPYNCKCNNIR